MVGHGPGAGAPTAPNHLTTGRMYETGAMTTPLRWGIASTGKISNSMATALAGIAGAEIVAVGSRTQAAADAFAAAHGISNAHGS